MVDVAAVCAASGGVVSDKDGPDAVYSEELPSGTDGAVVEVNSKL